MTTSPDLHLIEPAEPAPALAQLAVLQSALAECRTQGGPATTLSGTARAQTALLATLPPRYAEVLHGLLDRLESSALFSEESCSFSQKDLLDSLQQWADKAGATLRAAG